MLDIHQELQKFGLTSRQADVYVLLLERGELRIQEITEVLHMPRSSVYENLKALYRLGLAEEIIGDNFKEVKAQPLVAIRHMLDDNLQAVQRKLEEFGRLEEAIDSIKTNPRRSMSVQYFKGRSGARQMYWNSLKSQDVVYVYTEWGRQEYVGLKYYENFVLETNKRNIKERVLINLTPQILETVRRYSVPGSPIYRTKVKDIRVIDSKSVQIKGDTLIYDNVYAQVYLRDIEIHGFEIENPDFVQTQRTIYETLWNMAMPVTNYL